MSDSTTTQTGLGGESTTGALGRAAVAGVAAGLVFGLLIQFVLGRMTAIGALYTLGEPSLTVGWVAHLGHSALFGVVFGVVTWWRPLADRLGSVGSAGAVGGAYGATLWLVNIVFVWPFWLNAVGVSMLPFPYFGSVRPLFGHLVWGVLLGTLYVGLRDV